MFLRAREEKKQGTSCSKILLFHLSCLTLLFLLLLILRKVIQEIHEFIQSSGFKKLCFFFQNVQPPEVGEKKSIEESTNTTNTTETAGPKIEDTTEKVDLYHDTTYGSDKSASATLAHRLNRKEADNQVLAPGYSQTTPEDKNGHQVNPRVNPAQKKEKKVGISKEKRIILVTRRIKSEV